MRYPNGHLAACHHPLNVSEAEIRGAERDASSPQSAGDRKPDLTTSAPSARRRLHAESPEASPSRVSRGANG